MTPDHVAGYRHAVVERFATDAQRLADGVLAVADGTTSEPERRALLAALTDLRRSRVLFDALAVLSDPDQSGASKDRAARAIARETDPRKD